MGFAQIGALTAIGIALGSAVWAEGARQGVLVELFTSQGCSACPPADQLLSELVADPGIIALSLHVDYWDYIGWTDSFGQNRFTERQKDYARAEGSRTIYTPQMVVDGADRVEGSDPAAVRSAIAQRLGRAQVVLGLSRSAGGVEIAAPAQGLARPVAVQLVRYLPRAQTLIETGENAGLQVDYVNVVTSWEVLGQWDGTSPLAMEAKAVGQEGVAVVLQEPGPGQVIAAAALD